MSQGFHQGIFSFSASEQEQQQQQHRVAQQSRRDKLRVQGFIDPAAAASHAHPLGIEEEEEEDGDDDGQGGRGGGGGRIYEPPAGMLSEMFNFPPVAATAAPPGVPTATELLASQIHAADYRLPSRTALQGPMAGFGSDWYGGSGSGNLDTIGADAKQLNPESAAAAAMQLFLMNPHQQQPTSPPPPPPHHHHQVHHHHQEHPFVTHDASSFSGGQLVDSHGLSLSLSSSLHQFDMAKADQDVLYFNQSQQPPQPQQPQGPQHHQHQQLQQSHGYINGATVGVSLLRNSVYARAAQELLEEFCSVGRGHFRGSRGKHSSSSNPNPSAAAAAAGGGASSSAAAAGSSSSSKDVPPLSPADRFEHQRKKSKLLSMLDEVDRRYNHYCDQMQMMVTSFDSMMGHGAASPYTALAQRAMSRHFRCLKDAIAAQLRRSCEALGEKDASGMGVGSGITKGETPRLRLLDQSLRQQRAFHQMGMMEQEAWRPQRGLPERSVTILRAWLFEHFLHPYPSDADKHLLARQTGLSRNQVSNWFINARVRLWKPMVEEMYQQESKDGSTDHVDTVQTAADHDHANNQTSQQHHDHHHHHHHGQQQAQRPETEVAAAADCTSMHHHIFPDNIDVGGGGGAAASNILPAPPVVETAELRHTAGLGPAARKRLGTAGDVSLTLGLRHAGTGGGGPDQNLFSTVRDHFGGC